MLHEQNEGQCNNIKVNKSFQSVAEFRYLRMTLTNQNCIHGEIDQMNTGNAC